MEEPEEPEAPKAEPSQPSLKCVRVWKRGNKRKSNWREGPGQSKLPKRDVRSMQESRFWPSDRPPFLRFALYKENQDTMSAVSQLCRQLHLTHTDAVGYAGTKDKRACTTQWCTT